MNAVQFGVFITPSSDQPDTVVELAVLADQVGLDLVTFQDHPYQPKLLDAWTLLSYVAGRTERIRLAPNVLNLPLRPPAVMARAVAALDRLSGGRAELGIGAGGFWDAIEQMGGRRLTPGQSVDALAEAIDLMRALWVGEGRVTFDGDYYSLKRASRGPAPLHPPGLWIGAYKPRMLALTGRKGDGWLPSLPYLKDGDLAAGNAAIDRAAREAGRDPGEIRRMLNLPLPEDPVAELTRLALEERVDTFIVMADDPRVIEALAEIAVAVRDRVAGAAAEREVPAAPDSGLALTPTPDDGTRLSTHLPWDESTRPHRDPDPDTTYTPRGRAAGQHLIDVHDMLRRELDELRDLVRQVRAGIMTAGAARSELNKMALRQNDWTLGAFCSRYCRVVATHHSLEDDSIFPHLARDPGLKPVIDRLTDEHHVIHDAIEAVDHALVAHLTHPDDFEPLQNAIDLLTDTLLSHLSYEERELVEPLARLGFYPGQL
ncbi:LLM class flavin-dependent oxidoreductase [Solirubrobacter ginsenosidimutans]|uniref:LLM class flavin-dependent oxidoreductase n=1 Tax=Solirubrobacter ginsenosidimutans TaxID=490573 RepID=A0A9X3MZU0_9ACTN|nr:LLM class flavin-dependent oxidoreductase [Solirubrobacter ginsenosidimutans]MDA0165835.1 LLM class flavin-dependent oxidoreductase [Solirubrobacter ginsenosidimutans]